MSTNCLFGTIYHPIHIRVRKLLGKCIVAQKTLNALKYEDPIYLDCRTKYKHPQKNLITRGLVMY